MPHVRLPRPAAGGEHQGRRLHHPRADLQALRKTNQQTRNRQNHEGAPMPAVSEKLTSLRNAAAGESSAIWPPPADDRLRERERIKRGIAERRLAERKAEMMQAELTDIDSAIRAATAEHEARTAGLDAELQKLEAAAVKRLDAEKPASASEDARRREIVAELTRSTGELQRFVNEQKLSKGFGEKRVGDCWRRSHQLPSPNDLCAIDVANPRIFIEHLSAKEALKYAFARQQNAQKQVSALRGDDDDRSGNIERRRAQWECELRNANAALAAAQRSEQELREAMIAE
jgi:hypothetical protein